MAKLAITFAPSQARTLRGCTRIQHASSSRLGAPPRARLRVASAAGPAPIRTLIFDLDGTLYPNDNGYVAHIRKNAERYMHEKLGIPRDQVEPVRKQALALANQGYEFDAAEFTANMREGEELFMEPDAEVQAFLASLSHPMWILTNTGEGPARRALELLGIDQYFEDRLLGADFMGDVCKPQLDAFDKVLAHIGADAESTVMFEDSLKNVRACRELGMRTVFVTSDDPEQGVQEAGGEASDVSALASAVVPKCSEAALRAAMPELWA